MPTSEQVMRSPARLYVCAMLFRDHPETRGEGAEHMPVRGVGDVLSVNSDIHIAPDLATYYPDLSYVLFDDRFTDTFDEYDREAGRAKTQYAIVGVSSVVLAMVALEFEVFSLGYEATGHSVPRWATLLFPAMALLSISLTVWARLAGLRRRWLVHVFLRERLRQWRHQLLLDGQLMDLSRSNPVSYEKQVDDRWSQFQQDASIAEGKFAAFIDAPGSDQYLFIDPSVPQDEAVASQVLKLQERLRLDYQLSFGGGKLAGGGVSPGVSDITEMADWFASTTLVGAVAASVGVFVVQLFDGGHHPLSVWVSVAAVGLAVLSLGTRAVRAGLTIPGEQESYKEYMNRCQVLAEIFRRASNDEARWRVLEDLEKSAAGELRRFLRIKWDSRFIV